MGTATTTTAISIPAPGAGPPPDPYEEAEDAVRALAGALQSAGIALPSLSVDPCPVFTGGHLVELGRARPDVVRALAGVVAKGAGGGSDPAVGHRRRGPTSE